MAVQLTDEQRITVRQSSRFQGLFQSAMYNKAEYWLGQDGATPPGNDRVRWAKSRSLGARLVNAPSALELPKSYDQAVIFLKSKSVNPSDDEEVFDLDTVIDYMIEENMFDTLADNVFDEQIKVILF